MCIKLLIQRDKAAIADPSRIEIKQVFCSLISSEQFEYNFMYHNMIYDLNNRRDWWKYRNERFHEDNEHWYNGVLPLYLFDEHWEVAKRKIMPIFGIMATSNPLGFTDE